MLTSTRDQAHWQLSLLVVLHWRCWDNEWVVYNQGSGDTHLLDTVTAYTLMALEEGAATPAQLLMQLDLSQGIGLERSAEQPQTVEAHLVAVLQQLEQAGLIESVAA
jgi:PqqD family protein of HPr-rel-A system